MNQARILIVEDEFIVANDIEARLLDLGYAVAGKTDSGAAAIEIARSLSPDLVLMDIRLQGSMDGITAATEIRRRFKLPVVFLTAYADDSTLQRAKEAEPFGYILKPFEDRELRTNIEIALYKHNAEAEIRRLSRLYATLSQVNQCIVRVRSLEELFPKICQVALEFGHFKTAWIGRLDAATGALVPIAKAGDDAGIVIGESISHCGCSLTAIQQEQPCLINDLSADPRTVPCRELAGKAGLRACAAYPIRLRNQVCGVFVVGTAEESFFNDAETRLLAEVALDISFALDTLETERQRREAEEALKEREQHLETILRTAIDGFMLLDGQGKLLEVNEAYCAMSGYTRDELLQMSISDVESAETEQEAADHSRRIMRQGADCFITQHRRKDGKVIDVEVSATFQNFDGGRFVSFLRDITERKRLEQEREITIEFLRLVNASTETLDMIHAATTFFQEQSGCEAVGIRLREGDDYPYFEVRGFPKEFVLAENNLCARDDSGEVFRDSHGNPVIECMCGNVICGRFDPSKPFFTAHGSFWTNSTTKLLAGTTEADRQSRTRNRCNGEGYESVTLIPLHAGEEQFGLLQLNDRRKGQFSPEMIALWERLADQLAITLAKFHAEAALRKSELRYRSLFDNMAEGFAYCKMLFDDRGRPVDFVYLEVNDAFGALTGLENVVGKKVSEVIPGGKESSPELFEVYGRVSLTGQPEKFEIELKSLGIWFSISAYSSQREYFIAVFDNITERKRAEQKMRESEEHFRCVVESAPEGMFIQVDGLFRYLNPAALALFGAETPDQIVGQPLVDRVHPDYHAVVNERTRLMREERQTVPVIEEQYLSLDGTPFDVEVTAAPFSLEGCAGSIVFFRDITERKRADRAMQVLEGQFRQAQKLETVGRLAGGIAHDFNNLLMVIRSYTEMLQDRLPAEDSLRRNTQQIMKAADRAANLTGQMLAFSRKQVISPRVLDLNATVNETTKMLKRLIGEDIELLVSLAEPLWTVRADPDQIVQVLMNLCVNARDAMQRGGTLTIATGNVPVGEGGLENRAYVESVDYVTLSVTDTGEGISEDVQEQMFEPFFTTKECVKGRGLLVSSVYGILKHCGVLIWVHSELGQGTCFRIYLPREKGANAPALSAHAEQHLQGTETLLVVEDEEALRESIRDFMGNLGYTVLAAHSGRQALSLASEHHSPIDLLVTDVVMPKMSGGELSQMLTRLRPDLKTIFMSGYTNDATVRHGVGEAGVAFLQKPFSLSILARKVRDVIGSSATLQ